MATDEVAGYVLLEPVGAGASSVVHRAFRHGQPGRIVAIKRLHAPLPDTIADLQREAAVLAALHHPAIVPLLDVVPDGDGIALVLPFAPRGTLADVGGALPWPTVADLGARLAGALAVAHDAGVVHGDVKPSNVLFGADGEPRLADFGAGRLRDDVVGTPGYVAPEVRAGAPPDARSDVYALGIVLREALAPIAGAGVASERGTDAPTDLLAVIDRACAPDPADRHPSAQVLQAELAAVAGRAEATRYDQLTTLTALGSAEGPTAVETRPSAVPAPPAPTQSFGPRPPAAPQMPAARRRRRHPMGTVAAVALVVVAVVGGLAWWRGTSGTDAVTELLRPREPALPCAGSDLPAGALLADVTGRGCSVPVVLGTDDVDGRPMVTLTLPAAAGAAAGRYAVAVAGEVVLLGDWDCDGTDTPAVVRPATGEVFTYAGFGEVAAAPHPDRIVGTPRVVTDGTCDRIVGG